MHKENNLIDYPLVTFIVPLFNKEPYLIKTLNSLYQCHYPNKEIYIIDDCSTDNSLALAQKFAARHDSVKVIERKSNGGLSAARNTGLEYATGKYIQFWDADDIYDKHSLTKIIPIMEKNASDIATAIAERDDVVHESYENSCFLNENTNMDESPSIYNANSCCFKIYNRKFLMDNKLTFIEQLYLQDYEFNFRAMLLAKNIAVTPYILGEYIQVENSNGKIINENKVRSPLIIDELTKKFLLDNNLTRFETFRQSQTLKMVYFFFIWRFLRPKVDEWKKYATQYLVAYKNKLLEHKAGLKSLAKTEALFVLALIAITQDNNELAKQILSSAKTLPYDNIDEFIKPLISNKLDFNEAELKELCFEIQRKTIPSVLKNKKFLKNQLSRELSTYKNKTLINKLTIENLFLNDQTYEYKNIAEGLQKKNPLLQKLKKLFIQSKPLSLKKRNLGKLR